MHVVLTGPAGTGKTTLAHLVADLAQQAMLCTGYLPATATAEWSVAQTIGSIQDTAEGHVFLPGMVLESIESGCWLVIDELNRADVDSRSEEHTSELQSLMRLSYAVFCLKKKTKKNEIRFSARSEEQTSKKNNNYD